MAAERLEEKGRGRPVSVMPWESDNEIAQSMRTIQWMLGVKTEEHGSDLT